MKRPLNGSVLSCVALAISAISTISVAQTGAVAQKDAEAEIEARTEKVLKAVEKRFEKTRAVSARQNNSAFETPERLPAQQTSYNEKRNVYFGDTHIHTAMSFDSYLSGGRLSLDDAYRFARGEKLTKRTGEVMQISQPLDFVVMTDHSESIGLHTLCERDGLTFSQVAFCAGFDAPDRNFYMQLYGAATKRPPSRPEQFLLKNSEDPLGDVKKAWREYAATAEKYNEPGKFTAFAGYEYSPPLPGKGHLHRNVFFRSGDVPEMAYSVYDAPTTPDLWRTLEKQCTGDCEFMTAVHNMNRSWGLAYSGTTIDGDAYTLEDWKLRARYEPLAEIFQIKGSSECGAGAGTNDPECNFELLMPVCKDDADPLSRGCSGTQSFVRQGLKKGLELEKELGFNPYQTGFIGSTDTHSSNPGNAEEYSWTGSDPAFDSPAAMRLGQAIDGVGMIVDKGALKSTLPLNPGGLAAVWAEENTRAAIFDAMKRRETYAVSGNRIKLRFFAGWGFEKNLPEKDNFVEKAYKKGVPMGGELEGGWFRRRSPEFLVWAEKDQKGNNLQKIQIIKGWIENGIAREKVFDAACTDGLTPDHKTGLCPDNGATVNLSDCSVTPDKGASEIAISWKDPEFSADQKAFYYARVMENPSCRWSTYDALRLGIKPVDGVPATIQERAWSSPIWYNP